MTGRRGTQRKATKMRVRPGAWTGPAAALLLSGAAVGDVRLREGRVLPGEIVEADLSGVQVKGAAEGAATADARSVLVSWRELASDEAKAEAQKRKAIPAWFQEDLWRAASRLERGDVPAAEALFEKLFAAVSTGTGVTGLRGPDAAVIAEGAARCRIARGAQTSGLVAYLEWVRRARKAPVEVGGAWAEGGGDKNTEWVGGKLAGNGGSPWVSRELGLSADLPPMFVADASTRAFAEGTDWEGMLAKAEGDRVLTELIGWYRAAAQADAGLSIVRPSGAPTNHEGVRLVREIVLSRIGDAQERDAMRVSLRARYGKAREDAPAWLEAWCRAAVGRSLVREEDPKLRKRGVIELLHGPARFAHVTPRLSSLALGEAAATMMELGDARSAGVLVSELTARFPTHAAAGAENVRDIEAVAPAEGGAQGPASGRGGV